MDGALAPTPIVSVQRGVDSDENMIKHSYFLFTQVSRYWDVELTRSAIVFPDTPCFPQPVNYLSHIEGFTESSLFRANCGLQGCRGTAFPTTEDCAGGPDLRGCGDRATPAESHGRCDYRHHSFKLREINEAAFRGVEMPLSGNENTLSWPTSQSTKHVSSSEPFKSRTNDLQMLLRFWRVPNPLLRIRPP